MSKYFNKSLKLLFLVAFCQIAYGQDDGFFSGSLEANSNFFIADEKIGAANTPQYDHQLFGADAWLNLAYQKNGYNLGIRFDLFNNSLLPNPTQSYSAQGIGRWYISKSLDKLSITVGHIYDQIGSGIIFRSFEQRPLFIDNALVGVRLEYALNDDWKIKGFAGRQRRQFELFDSNIKGGSVEGFIAGKEGSKWAIAPGAGVMSRTQSEGTMDQVLTTVATYNPADTFSLAYNTYAFSVFNTLTAGKFSWYAEGAYKSPDIFFDINAEKAGGGKGKFVREAGLVFYSSLSYATKGFGATIEGKRTENFTYRTNPFVVLNRGAINFLPPMARINSYRLTSRYQAATQELGEQSVQVDLNYKPSRKLAFNVNFSNINDLDNQLLYREIYTEVYYKYKRKFTLTGGLQLQEYNQAVFEGKPKETTPNVETIIPYIDFLYKLDRKKAIRFEAQYMLVGEDEKTGYKQDYGDWLFGLVEFTIAPKWTFTASDMYNINPGKNSPKDSNGKKLAAHYPRFDVYFTQGANRFSLSYVKQVEGIVCSGGICRLEPAFSGVKFTVNSSF